VLKRLLLDECVDERLRVFSQSHMPNGPLCKIGGLEEWHPPRCCGGAAEAAGFDVLITADQNIPDQQNLAGGKMSLGSI
jgi:hypothetical protein